MKKMLKIIKPFLKNKRKSNKKSYKNKSKIIKTNVKQSQEYLLKKCPLKNNKNNNRNHNIKRILMKNQTFNHPILIMNSVFKD